MRFRAIASGSNGNSIYVGSDDTHVLIDSGISCKRILTGLHELDLSEKDLSGIFITHEHSDHISGLKVLLKKTDCMVYATKGTIEGILMTDKLHEMDPDRFIPMIPQEELTLGDLNINSIHVSHDAKEPSAYKIYDGKNTAAVMTDLGTFTDQTVSFLQGVNGLLLESNHEVRLLEMGSYPYPLKRRILSDFGHLSNEMSGKLLSKVLHDNLKFSLLGHLSEENNYPDIAFMTVTNEVNASDTPYKSSDFDISVAKRTESSAIYTL